MVYKVRASHFYRCYLLFNWIPKMYVRALIDVMKDDLFHILELDFS